MKRFLTTLLVLTVPLVSKAQGTVYDSNLGSYFGAATVDSSDWPAQGIETGGNAEGYLLDLVQVQMETAIGNPSGFTLSIFSAANGVPSLDLGNLSGSANPASSGIYTYDASTLNLNLAPSTEYFLVESATGLSSQGSYEWDVIRGFADGSDGWQNLRPEASQDSGNDWTPGGATTFNMAITATAVHEPSIFALVLSGSGFLIWNSKRKTE